jgi:YD repeat-containing protein
VRLWPDPTPLLPAPLALLALGRSKRRLRPAAPVGAMLLVVVAFVCAGATLLGGDGAQAAEAPGSASAEEQRSGGAEEMVTRTITTAYDPLRRLTGATYSTGESFAYAYDAVGNRTAYIETTPAHGTRTTQYEYNAANRLLLSASPGHSITYTYLTISLTF